MWNCTDDQEGSDFQQTPLRSKLLEAFLPHNSYVSPGHDTEQYVGSNRVRPYWKHIAFGKVSDTCNLASPAGSHEA